MNFRKNNKVKKMTFSVVILTIVALFITVLPTRLVYANDNIEMVPQHTISYRDDHSSATISFDNSAVDGNKYTIKQLISTTDEKVLYDSEQGITDLTYEAKKNGTYGFKVIYLEHSKVPTASEINEKTSSAVESDANQEVLPENEQKEISNQASTEVKEKLFEVAVDGIEIKQEQALSHPDADIHDDKVEDAEIINNQQDQPEKMSTENVPKASTNFSSIMVNTTVLYSGGNRVGTVLENGSNMTGTRRTFAAAGDIIYVGSLVVFTNRPTTNGEVTIHIGKIKLGDTELQLADGYDTIFYNGPDKDVKIDNQTFKTGVKTRYEANATNVGFAYYVKIPDDYMGTVDDVFSVEFYEGAEGSDTFIGTMERPKMSVSRPELVSNGNMIDDIKIPLADSSYSNTELHSYLFDGISVKLFDGTEQSVSDLFNESSMNQNTWTYADSSGLGLDLKIELYNNNGALVTPNSIDFTKIGQYYLKIKAKDSRQSQSKFQSYGGFDTSFDSDTDIVRRIWVCNNFNKANDSSENTMYACGKINNYVLNGLDFNNWSLAKVENLLTTAIESTVYSSDLKVDGANNLSGNYGLTVDTNANRGAYVDLKDFNLDSEAGTYDTVVTFRSSSLGISLDLPVKLHLTSTYPIDYLEIPKGVELDRDEGIDERHAGKKIDIKLKNEGVDSGYTFTVKASKNFILKNSAGDAQYTGTLHKENGEIIPSSDSTVELADLTAANPKTTVWLNIDKYESLKKGAYKGVLTFYVTYK